MKALKLPVVLLLTVLCFVFVPKTMQAQTDSLTTRNDADFKYRIKWDLMPDLCNLFNFISDPTASSKEIDEIINNKIRGNREQRIFYNDKVIVDYDLKPGADVNKSYRNDMNVGDYLNAFNTNYAKSEDRSVIFEDIKVSVLKYSTYYYYNVFYTTIYKSVNAKNESFTPFNRVAEVILINDSGWHIYIHSISFPDSLNTDSTNAFMGLIKTEDDVEKIYKNNDDERQKRKKAEDAQLKNLLEESDELYEKFEFEAALKKCRDARNISPYNKDIQLQIGKIKEAQLRKKEEDRRNAERMQHIEDLKIVAIREKNNYNFKYSKLICDSLITDYKVNNDTIIRLNDELSNLLSSLSGIETAMDKKDFKQVKKNCDLKILESTNKIYKAEYYYRLALAYKILSPGDDKKLLENVNQCLMISEKRHQEALKLRAEYYQNTGVFSSAVEDATQLINNDSRNPANYSFRAGLYLKDNNQVNAISDYTKAIGYHTSNIYDFYNKAQLEFNMGSFNECIKTTSEGINVFDSSAIILYYYRGLANDKLVLNKAAGSDFRKAIKLGLADSSKLFISEISKKYLQNGNTLFGLKSFRQAVDFYTKSVLTDSNETALYMRACSYIKMTLCDSAVVDLNALFQLNSRYPLVLAQRGNAYTCLEKYTEANTDFNNGFNIYATSAEYWYLKGNSELKQNNFAAASISFDKLILLQPSDSVYYLAALASYQNKQYDKAIEHCKNAKKQGSKRYDVNYICGRAYFDKGKFSDASGEFEAAKKLIVYNDALFFWYAASLEAEKKYLKAAQAYNLLDEGSSFYDSSLFRSAVCYIKTKEASNFRLATEKLKVYLTKIKTEDKSEAYAWLAYSSLLQNDLITAGEFVYKAKTMNDKNAMLLYVMTCSNVVSNMNSEALKYFDLMLQTKKFSKEDIEDEKLLKPLKKETVYQDLMKKYFN